eukprot:m.294311 g.294311  ORF g.294311 m.294311 type:complete len:140 (+) comp12966_c0_seq1:1900-2319(+)
MMSTAAVNIAALEKDTPEAADSGKLEDAAIRLICRQQFWVRQWRTSSMFCYNDINSYADNVRTTKFCSMSYSPTRAGYTTQCNSYNQGFGGWDTTGCIILQLRYTDSRFGSHTAYGQSSSDSGCTSEGGCHAQVFCRGD